MPFLDIHLFAVLVASVVSIVAGGLWQRLLMLKNKATPVYPTGEWGQGDATILGYGTNFLATFLVAYMLAYVITLAGAVSVGDGITAAFLVWVGFFGAILLRALREKKPFALFVPSTLYHLFSLCLMSVVLTLLAS